MELSKEKKKHAFLLKSKCLDFTTWGDKLIQTCAFPLSLDEPLAFTLKANQLLSRREKTASVKIYMSHLVLLEISRRCHECYEVTTLVTASFYLWISLFERLFHCKCKK